MKREELVASRWSLEKANAYMESFGVVKGVNYVPSYCYSYIEIWHHFREEWIVRELGYAKEIGINSLRIMQQVSDALRKRELIKIHVLDNCPLSAREAAEELSEKTESDVVQVIGSRLVLFKRNPKEPVIKF